MKCRILCLLIASFLLLFGCTAKTVPQNNLHVAVMVSEKQEAAQYLKGIELAAAEAQQKYKDYNITYSVYEDFDNYETGAGIVDAIASDPSVTAVFATDNMDISKLAVHEFEAAGKLTVAPYALCDSELPEHNHKLTFSTCFSAKQTGETARAAAEQTGLKRWAVCYADDDFSRLEARSFTGQKSDGVIIADTVKEEALRNDFSTVTKRWQQLGVEGVALFVYNSESLGLFLQLKQLNPTWVFIGDYVMDNVEFMESSSEHTEAFEGFLLVSQFYVEQEDDRSNELFSLLPPDEEGVDTWLIHGYNNFKMIVDTAVSNETNRPEKIADALRLEGYDGILQTFSFDKNGQLDSSKIVYDVFVNGEWQTMETEASTDEE